MTKCNDNIEIKESLADRLKALKTNQENWKNRINKDDYVSSKVQSNQEIINKNGNEKNNIKTKFSSLEIANLETKKLNTTKLEITKLETTKLETTKLETTKLETKKLETSKLADRLFLLEKSSKQWKNRVADKDNKMFTISGKMASVDYVTKKNLKIEDQIDPVQRKEQFFKKIKIKESEKKNIKSSEEKKLDQNKIEIPKIDANLDLFFKPIKFEKVTLKNDDNDFLTEIDCPNNNLLIIRKNVKLKNRKASKGNPLKKKNNTLNFIKESYEQSKESFFENKSYSKINDKKTNFTSIKNDLDPKAKAGLASKENYSLVANNLKKSSDSQDYLDSNNLLNVCDKNKKHLIQVKGRKRVQVRLVEPRLKSINEGDSYVFITNNLVIVYIGRFTNIIERTKVIDVGKKIFKRKEMGFLGGKLILIDNDKKSAFNENDVNTFLNLIKIDSIEEKICKAGPVEEDELYENLAIKQNEVYILDQENSLLKPYDSFWCKLLNQEKLNPNDAYVFDFKTEVYIWLGYNLTNEMRNLAIELGQKHYSENERPSFSCLYKCNQNMELILFQEKFIDWISNFKNYKKNNSKDFLKKMNLKTFDINEMLKNVEEPDFILDNTNLGRGDFYRDEKELLFIEVVTDEIKCWNINEYEKIDVKNEELGQFYDNETYVVRWKYRVNRLGKELDIKKFGCFIDKPSNKEENFFKKADRLKFRKTKDELENNITGRERYCYFYWQGSNCSVANKGSAALMAIELDKEKSSQVQVKQNEEPPCFLRLFKGKLIVYKNDKTKKDLIRLFLVKGIFKEEAFLYEVECNLESLRSKGCFILVNFNEKIIYLWIGNCINANQLKIAKEIFHNLNNFSFSTICFLKEFTTEIIKQSQETDSFFKNFSSQQGLVFFKNKIKKLLPYNQDNEFLIFKLSSVSGEFFYERLQCSYSSNSFVNNFPFEQKQIYNADQPAFFLLDDGETVYLWQGYFPKNNDNSLVGSMTIRYSQEKKCALETVLSYCHTKYQNKPVEAFLIHAGLEPDKFKQLFPEWTIDESIRAIQLKEGKKDKEMIPVHDVLTRICNLKNEYKLEDLKKKPLPDGINPLIIEKYLSDIEFQEVFNMTKSSFYLLPVWKQNKLKQNAELF